MSSRQRDTYEVLPAVVPYMALALVLLFGYALIQKHCTHSCSGHCSQHAK